MDQKYDIFQGNLRQAQFDECIWRDSQGSFIKPPKRSSNDSDYQGTITNGNIIANRDTMSPFTASVPCGQSELQTRQNPAALPIHAGEAGEWFLLLSQCQDLF